ncbi:MAG: hypothetical protein KO318_04965 [Methanobacterium sp.]|jgi:hypothetical protein|uniref:hypothetical protein n=1 Tax=Methanobacterium sp. TaxID=2164 RepID=UPI0025833EC0|nr:hypothetical protein [Methanobacterium sp.]MCC7559765.1 hypothetical protein [Methanobacterium sp.]
MDLKILTKLKKIELKNNILTMKYDISTRGMEKKAHDVLIEDGLLKKIEDKLAQTSFLHNFQSEVTLKTKIEKTNYNSELLVILANSNGERITISNAEEIRDIITKILENEGLGEFKPKIDPMMIVGAG